MAGIVLHEPHCSSLARAQACLVCQIAGDSLGALVEFQSASSIERLYPGGPRLLADGGTWDTLAGQPTDDSELALALARSMAASGRYDEEAVAGAYAAWYTSGPFDVGSTTRTALSAAAAAARTGKGIAVAAKAAANRESQANGALMRVSPLGVFGVNLNPSELAVCSRADASLTHPHPICLESNVVYTAAIAFAIRTGAPRDQVYEHALRVREESDPAPAVMRTLRQAASAPPPDYEHKQGWVLIALHNAFYQLLNARSLEEGIVDTVRRGGDTDTNAAITGALLGAVWGMQAVPKQWIDCILSCRPEQGRPGVRRPRPPEYWPADVLSLASQLLGNAEHSH